jgi:flavin-dependent dehydrogenase
MYDAIIVGARCAGSPTAMLLARKGYRVLLMDRDTFPSDTLSTAAMRPDAVQRMETWGLLGRLEATGCPPAKGTTLYFNGMPFPAPEAPYPMYAPRRTVLDKILVDAAREAGAEVREAFSAQDLILDASATVVGLMGQTREGEQVMEEGRLIIGADGRNSLIARMVGAAEYDVREPHSCGFYSYFSGLPLDTFELHLNQRHAFFYFPSTGGQVCVGIEAPLEVWDEFRKDTEGYFDRTLAALAPSIAARMAGAKREDRFLGMTGRKSLFRKPYGPGWALVGDAGFMKDPILGTGIDDAFRDATFLVDAIDAGFAGRQPLEGAMADYERKRNEAVRDLYPLICELAQMNEVTPELLMRMGQTLSAPAPAPA